MAKARLVLERFDSQHGFSDHPTGNVRKASQFRANGGLRFYLLDSRACLLNEAMSENLKVAVIGAGSLGKEHARLYAELADARVSLVGVCDVNRAQAERV